jgi:hypothetical protein
LDPCISYKEYEALRIKPQLPKIVLFLEMLGNFQ